jgi:hypothetical protein
VHESSGIVDYDCPACHAWIAFSFATPKSDARARKEYEAFLASIPPEGP